MANSPDHLPSDSTTEQSAIDSNLLTVQAAMIDQIAQATLGRLVLDDVLHAIAKQLQDTLQASGCLIVQRDETPNRAAVDEHRHELPCSSDRSLFTPIATAHQTSRVVPMERLYNIFHDIYQYYHSWLAQGKSVTLPGTGQPIPSVIWNCAEQCRLCRILIVPLVNSSSYLGGIILYQCDRKAYTLPDPFLTERLRQTKQLLALSCDYFANENTFGVRDASSKETLAESAFSEEVAGCDHLYHQREWTDEEIAFVQAIADQCAISLTCAALASRLSTELTKRLENESALEESQKRLRAICKQTCQFFGLLTPDGYILDVSQTALDFVGVHAQELLGRPFWEVQWWTPSVKTHKQLQEALAAAAAGKFTRYEVDVLGASKRVVTLDFSLKPHTDDTGQVVLVIFEGRDITAYKQAQSELQASLARNRALLEAIPDAIFRVTRDGIYLDRKAAKLDTLPTRSSEIIGQHLHQVLPTEVAGLIWHHVELALESNNMQIIEFQLWVNGKSHHFETRIIKSGTDEVAAIVQDITERVEVRDALEQLNDALEIQVAERTAALREANRILRAEIIERQRAEEQLKESEERFRNLVETSSDWVWEIDENAVYTYASPKVKSLLGYEPSEVLGKTPFDFMPAHERQRVANIVVPLATLRQPFTCLENTNIHKDGHLLVLERSGVPIFDGKGTFRGYRGIDRDITERKKAEKEVLFLHSITRAIFESQDFYAALGVAIQKVCESTGWDFGEAWVPRADGTVLECSPAWFSKSKSLEGFRNASNVLTFAPNVGLPGRVWVSQQPEWKQNVSTESNAVYLRAQIAKDVGLKAALGIPIIANEGVLAVLVFYMFESKDEDQRLIELISASTELGLMIQRKQAEGEIRKALEKEKELTELKSRFITMTSHEFRTPLTTILSSAELLENYGHKWAQEKKLIHLHRIQASVKHMTKLLNDVLILGKAEAGKLKLNPVPLDLENFCQNLVEELQLNDNNQHKITLVCDWRLGRGGSQKSKVKSQKSHSQFPLPYIDEKLLRQILENLLSNAIKYSPSGSSIEFTLNGLEKQAVFQIRDRGIGIPTEDRQRLFETFHRATNVGTIAGTGLGLAIVKKCVDIHQGQIAVESEVGVGTTFTVTLPIYNLVSTHEENSHH